MDSSKNSAVLTSISASIKPFLSIKDLQAASGKSRSTIYRWIAEGIMPKPIRVGGSSLWPEEIIQEWRQSIVTGGL